MTAPHKPGQGVFGWQQPVREEGSADNYRRAFAESNQPPQQPQPQPMVTGLRAGAAKAKAQRRVLRGKTEFAVNSVGQAPGAAATAPPSAQATFNFAFGGGAAAAAAPAAPPFSYAGGPPPPMATAPPQQPQPNQFVFGFAPAGEAVATAVLGEGQRSHSTVREVTPSSRMQAHPQHKRPLGGGGGAAAVGAAASAAPAPAPATAVPPGPTSAEGVFKFKAGTPPRAAAAPTADEEEDVSEYYSAASRGTCATGGSAAAAAASGRTYAAPSSATEDDATSSPRQTPAAAGASAAAAEAAAAQAAAAFSFATVSGTGTASRARRSPGSTRKRAVPRTPAAGTFRGGGAAAAGPGATPRWAAPTPGTPMDFSPMDTSPYPGGVQTPAPGAAPAAAAGATAGGGRGATMPEVPQRQPMFAAAAPTPPPPAAFAFGAGQQQANGAAAAAAAGAAAASPPFQFSAGTPPKASSSGGGSPAPFQFSAGTPPKASSSAASGGSPAPFQFSAGTPPKAAASAPPAAASAAATPSVFQFGAMAAAAAEAGAAATLSPARASPSGRHRKAHGSVGSARRTGASPSPGGPKLSPAPAVVSDTEQRSRFVDWEEIAADLKAKLVVDPSTGAARAFNTQCSISGLPAQAAQQQAAAIAAAEAAMRSTQASALPGAVLEVERMHAQGNERYKAGRYVRAVELFTQGLVLLASLDADVVRWRLPLLTNRAAAYIMLRQPKEALRDTLQALELEKGNVRAACRCAKAYLMQGRFAAATDVLTSLTAAEAGGVPTVLNPADAAKVADMMAEVTRLSALVSGIAALVQRGCGGGEGRASSDEDGEAAAKQLQDAAKQLDRLSSHDLPACAPLRVLRAQALLRLGRHSEAFELCVGDGATGSWTDGQHWCWWLALQARFHAGDLGEAVAAAQVGIAALERAEQQQGSGSVQASSSSSSTTSSSPRVLAAFGIEDERDAAVFFPGGSDSGGGGGGGGGGAGAAPGVVLPTLEALHQLAQGLEAVSAAKQRGNDAFKARKYTEAVEQYTQALASCDGGCSAAAAAVLHCNRAAAHHGGGAYADALADCRRARALNPFYTKAYTRLSTLLLEVGRPECAVDELTCVQQLKGLQRQQRASQEAKDVEQKLREARAGQAEHRPADHYRLFGLQRSCSADEVRKAYKKLALKHHPDKAIHGVAYAPSCCGSLGLQVTHVPAVETALREGADWLFKRIGEAHAVLSDEGKRRKLDLDLQLHAARTSARASFSAGGFYSRYAAAAPTPSWSDPFAPPTSSASWRGAAGTGGGNYGRYGAGGTGAGTRGAYNHHARGTAAGGGTYGSTYGAGRSGGTGGGSASRKGGSYSSWAADSEESDVDYDDAYY